MPQNLFLEKTIDDLLLKTNDLTNYSIVLPGKRPIIFIKELLKSKNYQGILPEFQTIEDLMFSLNPHIQPIDGIALWVKMYHLYLEIIPTEKFSDFIKWIPTILKDFDDILIFSETPEAVLDFMVFDERIKNWGNELGNEDLIKEDIHFWKNMKFLFNKMIEAFDNEQIATKGMLMNKAQLKFEEFIKETEKTFVFIGFNALSTFEETLIKSLLIHQKAYIYWDVDRYYFNDETQEAGQFLRPYSKWEYFEKNPFNYVENELIKPKYIDIISTPNQISQAKLLNSILIRYSEEELKNTAIVLADENLLLPVLESIPNYIDNINVTMGFPMDNLHQIELFKLIFKIHQQKENQLINNHFKGYYYQHIFRLFELINLESLSPIEQQLRLEIKRYKRIYWQEEILKNYIKDTVIEELLLSSNVREVINAIIRICQKIEIENPNFLQKHIFKTFKEIFQELNNQLIENNLYTAIDFNSLDILFQQIIKNETLSFIGNPAEGIQIMGLLETRGLAYSNLIMLNVNEGVLPLGRTENSFIPFDVKAKFKINTFLENDAIYAYHFYRLLQHTKNAVFIYNNTEEGLGKKEKSRFLTQLTLELPYPVNTFTGGLSVQYSEDLLMTVSKNKSVVQKLNEWKIMGISPTHLSTYLYNPIEFYYQKILGLYSEEMVEEKISGLTFGEMIHQVLENLYKPLINKYLTSESMKQMLQQYPAEIENYLKENGFLPDYFLQGHNFLQKEIADRTVKKILLKDLKDIQEGHSIMIKMIEKELQLNMMIDDEPVLLKGILDRVDTFDNQLRIIDYKSAYSSKLNIDETKLDVLRNNTDYRYAMQLVFYAKLALENQLSNRVECGLWSFKHPARGVSNLKIGYEEALDIYQINTAFEQIELLIKQILNPDNPFIQSESFIYTT